MTLPKYYEIHLPLLKLLSDYVRMLKDKKIKLVNEYKLVELIFKYNLENEIIPMTTKLIKS